MKLKPLASAFLLSIVWSFPAAADTSLELLRGWNYNRDFNGNERRTVFTIKTFQPWEYGNVFLYYDITGPFNAPDTKVAPNEKGGFFGGTGFNFSTRKIGQKIAGQQWDWGVLDDVYLHYEMEHVSKFGALHYYGLVYGLKVPFFDFVTATSYIRDDWSLKGVDLQLGGAWQLVVPLGDVTDIFFAGFVQWGLFGEGKGSFTLGPNTEGPKYTSIPAEGRPFLTAQPQLALDIGKLARIGTRHLYAGVEYQIAINRYLQRGVDENLAQLLLKWNILAAPPPPRADARAEPRARPSAQAWPTARRDEALCRGAAPCDASDATRPSPRAQRSSTRRARNSASRGLRRPPPRAAKRLARSVHGKTIGARRQETQPLGCLLRSAA